MVNEKYDMPLPSVIKRWETLKETPETGWWYIERGRSRKRIELFFESKQKVC